MKGFSMRLGAVNRTVFAMVMVALFLAPAGAQTLAQLQADYVKLKYGMFLHYNMSTYARCCCPTCYSVTGEHEIGDENPNLFKPGNLNCGQWADAAVASGMKYMVLVTKHHGGFCLWPTKTINRSVAKDTAWRNGKGDVCKEFVDSARSRGMKVGFYYSIWEKINQPDTTRIMAHLTELLTNYGPITCIWFDGWKWKVGYVAIPYNPIKRLIKKLQPNCLIVENNHYRTMDSTDIVEYESCPTVDQWPAVTNKLPSEANLPIRTDLCWFWHPNKNCDLKPAATIFQDIKDMAARNTTYLLDMTIDTSGTLPKCQVDRLKEVGRLMGVNTQSRPIVTVSSNSPMVTFSKRNLVVTVPQAQSLRIVTVYNAKGERLVFPASGCNTSIDLKGLSKGLYFAGVETDIGRTVTKFVVQ